MKRCISILMTVCMVFAFIAVIPESQTHAVEKKNGFYCFYPSFDADDGTVECKITKDKITIYDNDETCMMRHNKRFHSGKISKNGYKYMNGNKTFKLAKKIYVFNSEWPCHKVKKFGAKFTVSHARTLSKSKFYKKRYKLGIFSKYKYNSADNAILLYMIVKKGKVVAIGSSAGCIDKK